MIEQHTLGPWTHEGQGDITGIENDPANGWVGKVDVAHVYLRMAPGGTEANARLIAAAPSLYEYAASKAKCGDNEALKLLEMIHGRT